MDVRRRNYHFEEEVDRDPTDNTAKRAREVKRRREERLMHQLRNFDSTEEGRNLLWFYAAINSFWNCFYSMGQEVGEGTRIIVSSDYAIKRRCRDAENGIKKIAFTWKFILKVVGDGESQRTHTHTRNEFGKNEKSAPRIAHLKWHFV